MQLVETVNQRSAKQLLASLASQLKVCRSGKPLERKNINLSENVQYQNKTGLNKVKFFFTNFYVCPRLRDSYFSFHIAFFPPFLTQFFNITVSLFVWVCCASSPFCICVIACLCRLFFGFIFMFILECCYQTLDFTKG